MKKITLILVSLLYLTNVNGQGIEEFAKNYKDTSGVLAYNIELYNINKPDFFFPEPEVSEIYPTAENTNFIFEVGREVETNGYLSYTLIDKKYAEKLNKQRTDKDGSSLIHDPTLDKLALERCIRMINLQVKTDHTLMSDYSKTYYKEAHGKSTTPENAHFPIEYSSGIKQNIFLVDIYSPFLNPQVSLLSLYSEDLKNIVNRTDIQNEWNTSVNGHYENRMHKKHKKFGYAFIVVEVFKYDRVGRKIRFTISSAYEVFVD